MARPQGTCTVAAANRILAGLAVVSVIDKDGGTVYVAKTRTGHEIHHRSNTELVCLVIDWAIRFQVQRHNDIPVLPDIIFGNEQKFGGVENHS